MRFYTTYIATIFEGTAKGFCYPTTYEFLDHPPVAIVIFWNADPDLFWTDRII